MRIGRSQGTSLLGSVVVFGSAVIVACGGAARLDGVSGNSAGAAGRSSFAGGGNSCETVDCSNVTCRSDQVAVRRLGDCCDTCESAGAAGAPSAGGAFGVAGTPGFAGASSAGSGGVLDCEGVTCSLNCSNGEVAQSVPGSCCPQCRPQPPECLKGQAGFQQLYLKLTESGSSSSCVSDADCTLLSSYPKCGNSCPGTPVSVASAMQIESELQEWEATNCSTCTAIYLPCPAALPPVCVAGTCQSYHPL